MGAAVQSHYFSVGPVVPWAEPGVGVVATQAMVNIDWGPEALARLAAGEDPAEVIDDLAAADDGRHGRQLALLTPDGTTAAWTGARCIPEAGHTTGDGFSAQANMMDRPGVSEAMAAAWTAGAGRELGDRLLAALEAAEATGGDIRGRQSAAIVIVTTTPRATIREARPLELRVEDHPEPLSEMRRLLDINRGYRTAEEADALLESGDLDGSAEAYRRAMATAPHLVELTFWRALSLAAAGETESARALLGGLDASERTRWLRLAERLPATGILPMATEAWDALLGAPPGRILHVLAANAPDGPISPAGADPFVHCSCPHQLERVWTVHFGRDPGCRVAVIDPAKLAAEVVFEDLYELNETYPHVYGEVAQAGIIAIEPIGAYLEAHRARAIVPAG